MVIAIVCNEMLGKLLRCIISKDFHGSRIVVENNWPAAVALMTKEKFDLALAAEASARDLAEALATAEITVPILVLAISPEGERLDYLRNCELFSQVLPRSITAKQIIDAIKTAAKAELNERS